MRTVKHSLIAAAVALTIGMAVLLAATQDQVPKYGSGGSLVDSTITETGGKVGIGTTDPTQKLEVRNGNIRVLNTAANSFLLSVISGDLPK